MSGRLLSPPPCAEAEAEALSRVGQGSRKLEGWWLKVRQFHGLLVKRFHCARRNSKALSSQILLPAFFVCVAMTVALSVPEIGMAVGSGSVLGGPEPHRSGAVALPPSWTARSGPGGHTWGLIGDSGLLRARPPSSNPVGIGKRGLRPGGRRQAGRTCSGFLVHPAR